MLNILADFLDDDIYRVSSYLVNTVEKYCTFILLKNNHIFFYTFPNKIQILIKFIKNSVFLKINMLLDVIGADYPGEKKRFKLIYNLFSTFHLINIFFVIFTKPIVKIPTLTNLFLSASWAERECWDLFGILFFGHPDLRRILTDYGFVGYPLKKDFPISGYKEIYYDESLGRVAYFPVVLTQELRFLTYNNSWEEWQSFWQNDE